MIAKSNVSDGNGAMVPAGTYKAVITGVYYIGTHMETPFGKPEEPAKPVHKLITQYELHKGDATYTTHEWVTLSFHPKSRLRARASAILGRSFPDDFDFDPAMLLGVGCRVAVVVENRGDREREKITGVLGLDSDEVAPTPRKALTTLDVSEPGFVVNPDVPEWVAVRASRSPEFAANYRPAKPPQNYDDDKFSRLLN